MSLLRLRACFRIVIVAIGIITGLAAISKREALDIAQKFAIETCRGGTLSGHEIQWSGGIGTDIVVLKKLIGDLGVEFSISGQSWDGIKADQTQENYPECASKLAIHALQFLVGEDSEPEVVESVFAELRSDLGPALDRRFELGYILIYQEGARKERWQTPHFPDVEFGEIDAIYVESNDEYRVTISSWGDGNFLMSDSTVGHKMGMLSMVGAFGNLDLGVAGLSKTQSGGLIAVVGFSKFPPGFSRVPR